MICYEDITYKGYNERKAGSFVDKRNRSVTYDKAIIVNGEYLRNGSVIPITLKTKSNDYEKFIKLVDSLQPYDKLNCEIDFLPYNRQCSFYLINAKKV